MPLPIPPIPSRSDRAIRRRVFEDIEVVARALASVFSRIGMLEARASWYTRVRVIAASTSAEAVRSTVTYTIELLDVPDAGPVEAIGESEMVKRPGRVTDTVVPAAVGSEGEAWYFPDTAGTDTDQILRVHLFDERWAIEDCAS